MTAHAADRTKGDLAPNIRSNCSGIDFDAVNRAAMAQLPALLVRWLPGGRCEGREYVVRNPMRTDTSPGSFKVNINSGKWADFATGDKGGDVISLAAYLAGVRQSDAARQLARMLRLEE